MFQRAPKPIQETKVASPITDVQNIKNILGAIETSKIFYRHETIYPYIDLYKKEGVDIEKWYSQHAVTAKRELITDNFVHNKDIGQIAKLAEMLPLLANKDGRLGDFIRARVTKTAKQDDQGNSFIDLVIEINNTWIGSQDANAPTDVPAKMTFLVDVTSSEVGENFEKKIGALRNHFLLYGQKANVRCFKNEQGGLGLERPKIVVAKSFDYLEKVGASLGDCVTQTSGDSFTINKQSTFDTGYQKYFLDLVSAIGENAKQNSDYIASLSHDNEKRARLQAEYNKIVAFVEAYKKTPLTRKRSA